MCKVGDGLSRPVLIARETFSTRKIRRLKRDFCRSIASVILSVSEGSLFSQVIYCRGYSGEEPPLPIPNREVKLTIADGTAPPGGRVGSCGSSKALKVKRPPGLFCRRTAPTGAHVTPSLSSLPSGEGWPPCSLFTYFVHVLGCFCGRSWDFAMLVHVVGRFCGRGGENVAETRGGGEKSHKNAYLWI